MAESKSQQRRQAAVTDPGVTDPGAGTDGSDGPVSTDPRAPYAGTADLPPVDAGLGLPIGADAVPSVSNPQAPFIGAAGVPATQAGTAPAGSTWSDEAHVALDRKLTTIDGAPTVRYVITWAKAAIQVGPDAGTSSSEDPDAPKVLDVTDSAGNPLRQAEVTGEQVVLYRGELLPDAAVEGQGQFLVTIGAAVALSTPAAPPA